EFTAVGGGDADVGRAAHDVAVGEDDAALVDDDTGAERLRLPGTAAEEGVAAEEALEEWIIREGRNRQGDRGRIDIDHRWGHRLDHGREAELELPAALGNGARGLGDLELRLRRNESGGRRRRM